jgi:hypothetical protein
VVQQLTYARPRAANFIAELLAVGVAHDEAGVVVFPRRSRAAGSGAEPRLVLMRPQFRSGIYWQLEAPSISKIGLC